VDNPREYGMLKPSILGIETQGLAHTFVSITKKTSCMSRFTEQDFEAWCSPTNPTEKQRILRAIQMAENAVKSCNKLKDKDIEIFVQGSYANNTNVRKQSDVDVCVMLKDTFYSKYAEGMTQDRYGFTDGADDFKLYRKRSIGAVLDKYGQENVKPGEKSIKVIGNSVRVESDIVPSFQYRNYAIIKSCDPEKFVEGVRFLSKDGGVVINYPKPHQENSKIKNNKTRDRYKNQVRLIKRLKRLMVKQGVSINSGISSFLIECLLYNTPNRIFNGNDTYGEQLKQVIIYLYQQTKSGGEASNWKEVSGMLDLFDTTRKWDIPMVQEFLKQVWNFVGFDS